MTANELQKGVLLISEPSELTDISFTRAVLLLADYNNEGAVGFILNKPTKYTINDFIPDIEAKFIVYNGGPVEVDNLYFIHTVPDIIPNSIEISNGIFWGGDFDFTRQLINSGAIDKKSIRFFLGYTGWGLKQLEREIEVNNWVVTKNIYEEAVLQKPSINFWKEQIAALGGSYLIWSNSPENPILN